MAFTQGMKDDGGKERWDLLPWRSVEEVVKVMGHGAKKYGDNNWLHVLAAKPRYFAAAVRHLYAWWRGERYDEDSGLHHLAHCACCILFLIHFDLHEDVPTNQVSKEK